MSVNQTHARMVATVKTKMTSTSVTVQMVILAPTVKQVSIESLYKLVN